MTGWRELERESVLRRGEGVFVVDKQQTHNNLEVQNKFNIFIVSFSFQYFLLF